MLQIPQSTVHRILMACVVLMEAIFPCFNFKPDHCSLAIAILGHKHSQLNKTLILEKLWSEFVRLESG